MRRFARDPRTSWEDMRKLAIKRPDLRPSLAANPNLYPGLREWLASLGDPEIDRVLNAGPLTGNLPATPAPPPPVNKDHTRTWLIAAAVVLTLLLAAGIIYLVTSGDDPVDPRADEPPASSGDDGEEPPSDELPEPAADGEDLPDGTSYTGPVDFLPYDAHVADGLVAAREFEGTLVGLSSTNQIVVTSIGHTVIGWDLDSGEELWRTDLAVTADDPTISSEEPAKLISENRVLDVSTGEVTTLDAIPPEALYCGGRSDSFYFADSTDLVGVSGTGEELWRVEDVLSGYDVDRCAFYDTYLRAHPSSRQVAPATISASTGGTIALPGLSGWYDNSYLLPNGVVMRNQNPPAGVASDLPGGQWGAWDLSSGDLLAAADFTSDGAMPRLYTSEPDVALYVEAINAGWDSGYLIAENARILATTDRTDDGKVTEIYPVSTDHVLSLPHPINADQNSHTMTVMDDGDTLIVSPDPTEADGSFVAAYSLSQGTQLWEHGLDSDDQLHVSDGFIWLAKDTTIFYTSPQ